MHSKLSATSYKEILHSSQKISSSCSAAD